MKIYFSSLVLLFSLSTPNAQAQSFLKHGDVALSRISPPPAPGSLKDLADTAVLKVTQFIRTDAECARANQEAGSISIESFFGAPYGPLSSKEIEIAKPLYYQISNETDESVHFLKGRYNRQRPYDENTSLHPCIPTHPSSAYPSGHAAIARAEAWFLASLFPAKKDALLSRANQIALDRVIGGVHHPSDILAGIALGDQVWIALTKNKAFRSEYFKLK